MYLLESEVAPFINLPSDQLDLAISQYKKSDFTLFKKLNTVIQDSILRSRKIRQGIEQEVKTSLFHPSPDSEHHPLSRDQMEPFAVSADQLKERIMQNLGTYIDEQKGRMEQPLTPQKKEQILQNL